MLQVQSNGTSGMAGMQPAHGCLPQFRRILAGLVHESDEYVAYRAAKVGFLHLHNGTVNSCQDHYSTWRMFFFRAT